jgi:prefoldin subunit 5
MKTFLTKSSSDWHDYTPTHTNPAKPTEVQRLTERVAQLDCALEGHEDRIADLEQTIAELQTLIRSINLSVLVEKAHREKNELLINRLFER